MKNRWMRLVLFTLCLVLVSGLVTACTSASPIVGKWQYTQQKNQYLEFFKDGRIIFDDGTNVITGRYELIGEEYIKVTFEGLAGAFTAFFGADTWKVKISGDTMTLQVGGKTATAKRVR